MCKEFLIILYLTFDHSLFTRLPREQFNYSQRTLGRIFFLKQKTLGRIKKLNYSFNSNQKLIKVTIKMSTNSLTLKEARKAKYEEFKNSKDEYHFLADKLKDLEADFDKGKEKLDEGDRYWKEYRESESV